MTMPQPFISVVGYAGDVITRAVTITSNGVPLNITGYTLSVIVADRAGSAKLVQNDETTHTTPATGVTLFTLSAEDTGTTIKAGTRRLWLVLTDNATNETTVAEGELELNARPALT